MPEEKDIRFAQKKVDEGWKDQAVREKQGMGEPRAQSEKKRQPQASKPFVNLLSSLGLQAMIHLGEVPNPETHQGETDLKSAREIIELLIALKAKTQGNASPEESEIFESLLPELQMKFARKA